MTPLSSLSERACAYSFTSYRAPNPARRASAAAAPDCASFRKRLYLAVGDPSVLRNPERLRNGMTGLGVPPFIPSLVERKSWVNRSGVEARLMPRGPL